MALSLSGEGVVTDRGRLVPWDQVYHLEWAFDGAWVATTAGMLWADRTTADAIEQRIAPWEAERDAATQELPADLRAQWAELGPGESLAVKQSLTMRFLAGFLWLFALGFGLLMAITAEEIGRWIGGIFFVVFGALAAGLQVYGVGPNFSVDAGGIRTGGLRRRTYRWADLRSAAAIASPHNQDYTATNVVVTSRAGRFVLRSDYKEGPRLREAIRRCLTFRAEAVPAEQTDGSYAASAMSPRRGLWLDEDGLQIISRKGARLVRWPHLSRPEWLPNGAEIRAAGRRVKLWRHLGGADLARIIDQHEGGNEPLVDAAGELRREVIERWLGVQPGGAIACSLNPWVVAGCSVVTVLLLVVMVLMAFAGAHVRNVQGLVMLVAMVVVMAKSARSVQADARGLSVRRHGKREYHPWSAIQSITQTQNGWYIQTANGTLTISAVARNVGRVAGIVKRILAERELGAQLPSDAPVPEMSLSRVRATAPGQERGLSLAAGGSDEPS